MDGNDNGGLIILHPIVLIECDKIAKEESHLLGLDDLNQLSIIYHWFEYYHLGALVLDWG